MANILTMLTLEELSLVDNPANPLAMAPLYKRHSPKEEDTMTEKVEIEKSVLEAAKQKVDDYDRLDKECQMLRKALIENGFVIKEDKIEKKAEEDFIDVDGEKINKADIPAALLKKMEADAEELAKAAADAKEREYVAKAEEMLPHVAKDFAVELVKKFEDADEELLKQLAAIDSLFEEKMEEVGKSGKEGDMLDPEDKLEELAKAYAKEHKVSYAKAYTAVVKTDEGKALVKETYAEKGDS